MSNAESLRAQLALGPAFPRQILENQGFSQPTLSRALAALGSDVVRIGAARSIQYALRDAARGLPDVPVHRVNGAGRVEPLGTLVPVRPDGFVLQQADGGTRHSDGLPWWLLDMRPQGFLGRAFAARHAGTLGLPARLGDWNDAHVLRALLAHGQDAVGNLLLGDAARDHFLHTPAPAPLAEPERAQAYVRLAAEAASGERPGSSAGGEQPKFGAFVDTPQGPRHVLVKFSLPDANPITERWRDLLLAEHHALEALAAGGVPAARSHVLDAGGQRFLAVERFDRVGALGRRAVFSLAALDAEFVGQASAPWPVVAGALAHAQVITRAAAKGAALLYAFGTLIGNTDMHAGNLSFTSEQGPPCELAPAYDMLPMGFAPSASGALPAALPSPRLHASVGAAVWRQAMALARDFQTRLQDESRWSMRFVPCLADLDRYLGEAQTTIDRLA